MLRWRLLLGALLIAALIALCWLDNRSYVPGIWLIPIVVAAVLLVTKEVLDLLAAADAADAAKARRAVGRYRAGRSKAIPLAQLKAELGID